MRQDSELFDSENDKHYLFEPEDDSLPEFVVMNFSGKEEISQLTHFEIELACDENLIDLADFSKILNKRASLRIWCWQDSKYSYAYHGIISSFQQIYHQDFQDKSYIVFKAELVPLLWRLTLRHQSRIFQNKSVPQIIEAVLVDAGLQADDYEFSSANQQVREFCVQYRESDFNFISRLMEDEGLFYFFKYDSGKDVLIISDHHSIHEEITPSRDIDYSTLHGMHPPEEEFIHQLYYKESVLPTNFRLKDFNYESAHTQLLISSPSDADETFTVYDYPGSFSMLNQGAVLTNIRREESESGRRTILGAGNCRSFCAGYRFTLVNHNSPYLNCEYLLTSVHHHGVQGVLLATEVKTSYENQFECIPMLLDPADLASVNQYRPPRKTPRPSVQGTQTAIVVGPSGNEIYTDSLGRVKIQFHWDLQGSNDDKSSCWVRVGQLWAGKSWGAMFIPRIGQEVIVDFLEGDPDRPIIIGCVYNSENPLPRNLPANQTQSTIMSDSTPGSGGSNEIRFEDSKGNEEIYIHAQKDMNEKIENNMSTTVGVDQTITVGGNRDVTVSKDEKFTITENETVNIGKNETITIEGDETVTITGDHTETVKTGNYKHDVQSGKSEQVVEKEIDIKSNSQHIHLTANTDITLTVGNSSLTMKSDGTIDLKGVNITVDASDTVSINGNNVKSKADADHTIDGNIVRSEATSVNTMKGNIVISDATTVNTVKGELVTSEASAVNTVKGGLVLLNP